MKVLLLLTAALAVLVPVVALGVSRGPSSSEASDQGRMLSVLGVAQVQGEDVFVDVWVLVLPGQDEPAVAEAALAAQGARPADPGDLGVAQFTTSGLLWDQFFDANPGNNYVTQYYNPVSDPTGGNGEAALTGSEATWSNVATSSFAFHYGGQTSRCPSLVDECPGDQLFDGLNDVAWLALSGGTTLGVTWYGIGTDEADMALNTNFNWHAGSTSCTNQSGKYDAQTVFLHENGHVVGLGHSDVSAAVMYPTYGGARCQLHEDDISGVSSLYPDEGATPTATTTPSATRTPTRTATPTSSPSATPTPTVTATSSGGADGDGDGVPDTSDNCPSVFNPGQENTDAAIDNGPGVSGDDATIPDAVADAEGDACETDGDIDNDGLPDGEDTNPLGSTGLCAVYAGASDGHPSPAGGDVTNDDDHDGDPALATGLDVSDNGPSWDTDNDGVMDGYECAHGSNPRDRTSKPLGLPDDNADSDGDGLRNGWERAGWGTNPNAIDSDGDGLGDCKEAADVNGDGIVDFVGDTLYYARAALLPRASFGRTMDFDINKDGLVDFGGDVIQETKFALFPELCK
jgi:hypothetical protein